MILEKKNIAIVDGVANLSHVFIWLSLIGGFLVMALGAWLDECGFLIVGSMCMVSSLFWIFVRGLFTALSVVVKSCELQISKNINE